MWMISYFDEYENSDLSFSTQYPQFVQSQTTYNAEVMVSEVQLESIDQKLC